MTISILIRLTHLLDQPYRFLTTTASYCPRSTIASLRNGTRYFPYLRATAFSNKRLGSRDLSSTLMCPHWVNGHVTTRVMISATTYNLDRTRNLVVAVVTIHVIVHMLKGVVSIGGITMVIVVGNPVLRLAVTTLLLDVRSSLVDQTGRQNQHVLAETNPTRISKSSTLEG